MGARTIEHFQGLWSQDPAMHRLFRIVERVARTDVRVLVRGETGAGKELIAQAVHALSQRARRPFRAINCAALPASLLESELFGHVKGAFTGAIRDAPGHLKLASGGTLFLDEVGEMPLELQAKLLRVLETGSVTPVGGMDPFDVDVRIVAATHRALRVETDAGRFRADLLYRLRVVPLFLPALRERPDDVPLLIEKLLPGLGTHGLRWVEQVSPAALRVLVAYPWPGNVRELRSALEYALVVGDGPRIELADLPPEVQEGDPLAPELAGDRGGPGVAPARIRAVLAAELGHRGRTAARLGISRVTLWRRMRAHQIQWKPIQ